MKRSMYLIVAGVVLLAAGCSRQDELEHRNQELNRELAAKDQFIEDVTSSINEIHTTLENTWALEKNIVNETGSTEKQESEPLTPVQLKEKIINRISDMRSVLSENRKKIARLEMRLRGKNGQYSGLEKMVSDLKKKLEERERSITDLSSRIQDLEGDVQQKSQIIAAHEITITENENTIDDQTKQLNTVYYVAGSSSELKEKGVIENEGGVLWGLMGTTPVLNPGFDDSQFQSIDKTKNYTIPVRGRIDEIIPKRDDSSYVIEQGVNDQSVLVIFHPEKFWKEKHLAIVVH